MNSKIDLSDLFFSADGRAARAPFILASGTLLILLRLYQSLARESTALHWVTGLFVYGLLVFTGACVLSKRLHDRGRSGWWSLVILLCVGLVWPFPDNFPGWISLVILVWAFVELVLMPGEQGANRFGPPPHKPGSGDLPPA